MKTCGRCKEEKMLECFRVKDKIKGTIQSFCIDCNKAYNKEHYKANRQSYIDKAKVYRDAFGRKPTPQELYLYEVKCNAKCADCGESDPIVLTFDHRDRSLKSFTIASGKSKTIEEIKLEIEKCDIRCFNCHAKITAKQFNWYRNYGPLE
jgi:hypothetical protein